MNAAHKSSKAEPSERIGSHWSCFILIGLELLCRPLKRRHDKSGALASCAPALTTLAVSVPIKKYFHASDSIAVIPSSFGALLHVGANITGYKSAASIFLLKSFPVRGLARPN
jgi:hypothetical protein